MTSVSKSLTGSGATIEQNLITSSAAGIEFLDDGNLYVGSRFSGNTTDLELNGFVVTDGGGNISY